jgi:hypothetical protein
MRSLKDGNSRGSCVNSEPRFDVSEISLSPTSVKDVGLLRNRCCVCTQLKYHRDTNFKWTVKLRAGVMPQSVQLHAQVRLEGIGTRHKSGECVFAVRAVDVPVFVRLHSNCSHVTEVAVPLKVCETRSEVRHAKRQRLCGRNPVIIPPEQYPTRLCFNLVHWITVAHISDLFTQAISTRRMFPGYI